MSAPVHTSSKQTPLVTGSSLILHKLIFAAGGGASATCHILSLDQQLQYESRGPLVLTTPSSLSLPGQKVRRRVCAQFRSDYLLFRPGMIFCPEHACCHGNHIIYWPWGGTCRCMDRHLMTGGNNKNTKWHGSAPLILSLPNSLIPVWAQRLLSPLLCRIQSSPSRCLCVCFCSSACLLCSLQCFDSSWSVLSPQWQGEVTLSDTHMHTHGNTASAC